jgi:cysteine synthase A
MLTMIGPRATSNSPSASRYLSSPLFEGIAENMTPEETALSLSTPGFHMPAA